MFLGSYSECVEAKGPGFSGQYVLANVSLPPYFVDALQVIKKKYFFSKINSKFNGEFNSEFNGNLIVNLVVNLIISLIVN